MSWSSRFELAAVSDKTAAVRLEAQKFKICAAPSVKKKLKSESKAPPGWATFCTALSSSSKATFSP